MAIASPRAEMDAPKTAAPAAGRRRLLWAILVFACAVGLTAFRTVNTFNVPGQTEVTRDGMKDFRDAIYFPVVAYLAGVNPYGPAYQQFHPEHAEFPLFGPLTFLVHLPFGLLPYPWAAILYFAIQVVLIVGLARLLLNACRIDMDWATVFAVASMIAFSRPGHVNLWLGQLGLTMALGCLVALHFAKSRPWLAGMGIALVAIKPNYAVPLVVLMLCRRDFRAVAIGLLVSGVATAAVTAVLVARIGSVTEFADQLLATYGSLARHPGLASIDVASGRIDALSTFARFSTSPPPGWLKLMAFCGCLLLGGAATWRLSRRTSEQRADGLSAAVICLCLLACIYHNSYDAVLLFIPALAVAASRNAAWCALAAPVRWLLVGLLALPLLNYVSTTQIANRLSLAGTAMHSIMSINSVVICLLFVLLAWWALFPARRDELAADATLHS